MNDSRKPTTARPTITRRRLLQSTMAAGAGLTILPSGLFAAANSPNNKLNVAVIGTWGRARAHFNSIKNENVVALCDVSEQNLAKAADQFPGAKHYFDWRQCLEQKDIDAVVCSTTDHTHAFIANWALNRDMHVFCEKPLTVTLDGEIDGFIDAYQAVLAVMGGIGSVEGIVTDGATGDRQAGVRVDFDR